MKKTILLILSSAFCAIAIAQPTNPLLQQAGSNQGEAVEFFDANNNRNAVDTCGSWTGYYYLNKLTALEAYFVSRSAVYSGHAQYYSAPQPLVLHGMGFYGYAETLDSIPVVAQIREASPVDSVPGAVLATDTVYVQNGSFQTNFLGQQYYEVLYNTPINVTSGYNLSVKNLTNDTIVLYSNSYANVDGNGEYLNTLYYSEPAFPSFEGWYRSSLYGPTYDADFLMLPILSTEIFEPFSIDANDTICEGDNLCIEYSRKPIFDDHMYADSNFVSEQSINFNWGDGFFVGGLDIACHLYDTTSMFTLTDSFYYWNAPNQQPFICAIEESAAIQVYKNPTLNFSYTINGSEVTFINESYNASDYEWNFGNGDTSTVFNPVYDFINDSTYIVTLYGQNQCYSDSISDTIVISSVSLHENELIDISIFPNPTEEILHLTFNNNISAKAVITDVSGKTIKEFEVNEKMHQIDVHHLKSGIYFLNIQDFNIHKRWIKK